MQAHEGDHRRDRGKVTDRAVDSLWVSPSPNPGVGARRGPVQGTGKHPGPLTAGRLNRVRAKRMPLTPYPSPNMR